MHTFLYILWFLLPTAFFLLALFAKLEQMGGSVKKQNPIDFLRQGMFVLGAVIIAVIIDRYFLEDLVTNYAPDYMPLGLFQVLLLPAVLVVGSYMIGPSKAIMVGAPKPKTTKKKGR